MTVPWRRRRPVPVILQATTTECGLASLSMVMAHHEHHVPMPELRARVAVGRDGVSMLALKRIAEEEGFSPRAFRGSLRAVVEEVGLPLVAAWDEAIFLFWSGLLVVASGLSTRPSAV